MVTYEKLSYQECKVFLAACIALKEHGPEDRSIGICENIESILEEDIHQEITRIVGSLAENWEYFSGDEIFPVLGEAAYFRADDKWMDMHGVLRYSLLDHIIQEMESFILSKESIV